MTCNDRHDRQPAKTVTSGISTPPAHLVLEIWLVSGEDREMSGEEVGPKIQMFLHRSMKWLAFLVSIYRQGPSCASCDSPGVDRVKKIPIDT